MPSGLPNIFGVHNDSDDINDSNDSDDGFQATTQRWGGATPISYKQ